MWPIYDIFCTHYCTPIIFYNPLPPPAPLSPYLFSQTNISTDEERKNWDRNNEKNIHKHIYINIIYMLEMKEKHQKKGKYHRRHLRKFRWYLSHIAKEKYRWRNIEQELNAS